MLEILQYCHSKNCTVAFSFEIPGQITITIKSNEFNTSFSQSLPWDHIYDEKVVDCVKYCIEQVLKISLLLKTIPIEDLGLSVRAYNCLKSNMVNTLYDLIQQTEEGLLLRTHLGHKTLLEIEITIKKQSEKLGIPLTLGMNTENF